MSDMTGQGFNRPLFDSSPLCTNGSGTARRVVCRIAAGNPGSGGVRRSRRALPWLALLALVPFGRARGNNPNVLTTPCIYNDEHAACRSHAERDESPLAGIGLLIRDRDGVGIVKNRNCLGHPDAVLAEVDPGFARFVPFEAHEYSVRTLCAYVKGGFNIARVRVKSDDRGWAPEVRGRGRVIHVDVGDADARNALAPGARNGLVEAGQKGAAGVGALRHLG